MEINYNIVSLIDILGLVQGVFLGLVLIIEGKRIKPKLFLGLFLIAYCAELLNSILRDLYILESEPWLLFLPFNFFYLILPLFYIYVKGISNINLTKKKIALILLPGILEFIGYTALFMLSVGTKVKLHNSESFSNVLYLIEILSFAYSMYYIFLTIKFINKQKTKVEEFYSNTEGKLLTWAKGVLMFLFSFLIIILSSLFLEGTFYDDYIYPTISIVNVVFIFWIGISGIKQSKLFVSKIVSIKKIDHQQSDVNNRLKTNNKDHYEKLITLMDDENLFLEPNLSLADVSLKLKITQRNLSELIRDESDKNFNQFVNHYRVEEAKKLLLDTSNDHLNMLGIAFDSGFSSKATFYSVFKKHTLQTPKLFKNNTLK
ncbi:helix-turn-helix transcriptional regulator [Tenacibaculum sp. 1_MG-2023]|uniref:helix-turn-helix transcriptional regulator n=1 Tax=Tenacibaculum sp. 1_MG-2023 TaxID=3062653 RepID=UPI0026E494D4|nr:helix-turn-helix transcriptional regulator [Tenacibaculum sp. 1_MG-2023]MDO6601003.1 helix-turn-helix transcriptional regulator [Tenacibaculum sp. 1_MG-2023]